MLALVLTREGFFTITVPTTEQALVELDARAYDVVLCDIRLPHIGGLERVEEIRRRASTLIMMSATGSIDIAIEAMKRGAYDYIAKPFKPDDVILVLRKAEERERARCARDDPGHLRREGRPQKDGRGLDSIVARAPQMQELFRTIKKLADFKTTVLVTGESGTGKELVARAIHQQSSRAAFPLVAVNCGAIPPTLLESELFGHRRGAFTDAVRDKRGLFEEASGGTLFLDEIGELPHSLQVKLLRALQEQEVRPLGSTVDIKVDTRVVAATIRDLQADVLAGRFREDLFYRLNVLHLRLPPLRDRREDIPVLIEHFISTLGQRLGAHIDGVSPAAHQALVEYSWPGNVRELENTIERAMVLSDGPSIERSDLPEHLIKHRDPIRRGLSAGSLGQSVLSGNSAAVPGLCGGELSIKKTTRAIEEELIRRALRRTKGNRTSAAKILEISHRALLYKIKEFGIAGP